MIDSCGDNCHATHIQTPEYMFRPLTVSPVNKIYMTILVRHHKSATYEAFIFLVESAQELILTRGGSTVRVV